MKDAEEGRLSSITKRGKPAILAIPFDEQSLYVFGGAFVVALVISLLMKIELKRLHRHYSSLEVEAARPHTHDL